MDPDENWHRFNSGLEMFVRGGRYEVRLLRVPKIRIKERELDSLEGIFIQEYEFVG